MPFSIDLQNEIIFRGALVLGTLLVVFLLTRLGQRLARRYIHEPTRVYHVTKRIRRTGGFLAATLIILLLSPDLRGLLTVLTVIGAGLAIAMREALLSFAGWLRITFLSPYKHGDRIQVNGIQGDVIDIRMLRTTLMEIGGWVQADQSTGRIVHIPNSWIFEHALYNYTRGFNFIWNEISFNVSFRSNWEAAQDIMRKMGDESAAIVEQQAAVEIRDMSREFLIHYSILTPFVYVRVVDNGVRLTLRYLCEVRKRRGTEHALTVSILMAFKDHGDIELAYPMLGLTTPDTPQFGPMPGAPPAASG